MKIIESNVEYIPQEYTKEGIYKHIEKCARICYKSEDKITADSAKPFVERMIKSKHLAMLEHGTVYLTVTKDMRTDTIFSWGLKDEVIEKYKKNKYSRVVYNEYPNVAIKDYYITTNLRVLVENNLLPHLDRYLTTPTENHVKRHTFRFITSIGVSRELNRHKRLCAA